VHLLRSVVQARDEASTSSTRRPKLVLKISPDLDSHGLDGIADAVGIAKGIDGVIVSNTTTQRPAHLRGGRRLTSSPLLCFILTSSFYQRIAQSKAVSPGRRCSPLRLTLSVVYGSACQLKYRLSAVAGSHLARMPWRSLGPVRRAYRCTPPSAMTGQVPVAASRMS